MSQQVYSFISLKHKVAATTKQLATTTSPIRMSRRQSHHLASSHHLPVSDDTNDTSQQGAVPLDQSARSVFRSVLRLSMGNQKDS